MSLKKKSYQVQVNLATLFNAVKSRNFLWASLSYKVEVLAVQKSPKIIKKINLKCSEQHLPFSMFY